MTVAGYTPERPRRLRHAARPGDAWLFFGDLHHPIQDQAAVDAVVRWWGDRYGGHRRGVCFQGDTVDCHSVSPHQKKAERLAAYPRLVDEAQSARPLLEWAAGLPLGAIYIEGNHERWARDLVDANPGLSGCPGAAFPVLVGLDDIPNVEWLPVGSWAILGDRVAVTHGNAKGFPRSLMAMRRKYPRQFTIFGHTHKAGIEVWSTYGPSGEPSTYGAMNVGHMSKFPEYLDGEDPDWVTAFGVVEFGDWGDGRPFFIPSLHYVVRGKDGVPHVA